MSGTTSIDIYRRTYRQARRPIKSVGASTTLTANDNGALVVVTAVATITLPAVAGSAGIEYTIINAADAVLTITAPAGTLVAFNNAAATSIAYSTSSEKIGSGARLICDGTLWYAMPILGSETATPTIS